MAPSVRSPSCFSTSSPPLLIRLLAFQGEGPLFLSLSWQSPQPFAFVLFKESLSYPRKDLLILCMYQFGRARQEPDAKNQGIRRTANPFPGKEDLCGTDFVCTAPQEPEWMMTMIVIQLKKKLR